MSKTIYVKYLVTNKDYDITVQPEEKVKDLKSKIESLLSIKLKNKLMIKHKNRPTPTNLNNEEETIKEAKIKNGDLIIIGKNDVAGGKKMPN